MVVGYRCIRCGYVTNYKGVADRHLTRKNPCPCAISNEDASIELFDMEKRITCKSCNKAYARRDARFRRHEEGCMPVVPTHVTNITNNSNNNNVTNNVQVNSYQQTDYSMLTNPVLKHCLGHGIGALPKMMEFVHGNIHHRQNHNIYVPNISRGIVAVNRGRGWEREPLGSMITQIRELCEDLLEEFAQENDDPRIQMDYEHYVRQMKRESRMRDEITLFATKLHFIGKRFELGKQSNTS